MDGGSANRMFLEECRGILGARWVVEDGEALARAARCTFPWPARPLALVLPGSAQEASACLALAGRHGSPVHPISRGRSWGLGSGLPARDAVILDLSRLDRIIDIDADHGTVRIEPGVTFARLQAALAESGIPFHLPSFGGPPDASVLANALDRGEGSGAFGDRFANLWDLDIALTTGERLRSGYGRFACDKLERVHARPAGPLIEGLFSQSGFGCVLSGRLALAPTPAFACYLTFEIGKGEALAAFVAATRRLMREEVIGAHDLFFWDGAKRLSASAIRASLDDDDERLAQMSDWAASIAIAGHQRLLYDGRLAVVLEALTPLAQAVAIHEDEDEKDCADAGATTRGLRGESDGANLTSCYWAKPALADAPLDPDRDRCGFVWLCPVLPMAGEALSRLDAIVRMVADEHGVFVASGAEAVNTRSLLGYVSIAWDRDEVGADDRAMTAHDALADRFAECGFLPYRLTLPGIARVPYCEGDWAAVMARLRRALDPNNCLAAGRVAGLP